MLHYHSIRPGDRLTFHNKRTVHKLLASVNNRFFFIPVSHRGHFTYVEDPSSGLPVMLSELSIVSSFPFRMCYHRRASGGGSKDPGLPDGVPLRVDALVSERTVLATKIHDDLRTFQAFLLPLRTRITVGVEKDGAANKSTRNVILSDYDSYAEEVSEDVYNDALKGTRRDDTETQSSDTGNCRTTASSNHKLSPLVIQFWCLSAHNGRIRLSQSLTPFIRTEVS